MMDWAQSLFSNLSQGEWVLVAILFGCILVASSVGRLGEAVALWIAPPPTEPKGNEGED
jgi:hypothetical protein